MFVLIFAVVVLTCFAMYGCVCVGVLVIRVLVFTVFCIVCTGVFVLFRLCVFLFVLSWLLPPSDHSISVNNNNNNIINYIGTVSLNCVSFI